MSRAPSAVCRALAALSTVALAAACSPDEGRPDAGQPPAAAAVAIEDFSASRTSVPAGSVVTLSWRTRAAATCSLAPGFGAVPRSGSVDVTLTATTTFTLTCAGGGGTASADVAVQVLGAPADAGVDGGGDAGVDGGDDDGGVDGGVDAGPAFVLEGALAEGAPIASFDELTDDTLLWLVPEREGVVLDEDLPCDIHFPNTYDGSFGAEEPRCTLPGGTRVDSYLLHAFSLDGASNTPSGSVTFAREIVALQWRSETLLVGDQRLGRPGVSYGDPANRDFGVGYSDAVTLGSDRRTLTLTLDANNTDDLRVITLAEGEPPPLVLSTTLAATSGIASLERGAVEQLDDAVWLFERTVTLDAALATDLGAPARATETSPPTPGTIPAGTTVRSALVHFDPPLVDAGFTSLVVTATLPSPVLGIVMTGMSLAASDAVVGHPETNYSEADGRGMELLNGGEVWLSDDGRSLRVFLGIGGASTGIDELRVLYAP